MCGIAGFATSRASVEHAGVLRRMARAIAHRGPDDEGFLLDTTAHGSHAIGLAHRRLSIIDLEGGHQPLGNEDGSVQVVFNGEIYNYRALREELAGRGHRFATASDTETIVHAYEAYGTSCVEHLDGMFAFALWDARNGRLFLARDRFGKKPLYLYHDEHTFAFASEIKALLQHPEVKVAVDEAAVGEYLEYRYVPGPRTLFSGICKLNPGTCLIWERGMTAQRRFYEPPDASPPHAAGPVSDPVGGFLERLDEAVRARMVSDVPFGAFLSGGIDSSAIVTLMARHSDLPVRTFSVGFAEARYSETHHARETAALARCEHHELIVDQKNLVDELPGMVRCRDAPVSEPSDVAVFMLAREARRSVKMVLTGEGSDEVLGGYPKHVFERFANAYHRVPAPVRERVISPLVRRLPFRFHRAKTAAFSLGLDDWDARMPSWFGSQIYEGMGLTTIPLSRRPAGHRACAARGNTALRRILCFDQSSWLPDNLLERGDSMTMAHSLEARMPFMDHAVAEYVSRLPDRFRVRGLTTKWILRQAMREVLPTSILNRPKVGFRVPVNEWFRNSMREFLLDHVSGPSMVTACYYDRARLEALVGAHLGGKQNHEKLLWAILNLEIWHRHYARQV